MKSRMPINFEKRDLTFPFKIYAKIEDKKLYVAVEKMSILYDYFNDRAIDIKNIGKFLQSPNNQSTPVFLVVSFTQKGTVITGAQISLSVPSIEPKFDSDGYLTSFVKTIGTVNADENLKQVIVYQSVLTNLTKYACTMGVSSIL